MLLYKTRWEIEKVFDETKTKLQEKKSWATTTTAKEMQAHFVAIVHNLLLLLQDWHQQQGVENTAEIQRRQKRLNQQETELEKTGQTLPLVYTTAAALHPGDVQTHPLAARPLASTHLTPASPAPATLPLCQTLTTQTKHQCRRLPPQPAQFMDGVMFMHSRRLKRMGEVLNDGNTVGAIRILGLQFPADEFFRPNIWQDDERWEPYGCWGSGLVLHLFQPLGHELKLPPAGKRPSASGVQAIREKQVAAPTEFSAELFFEDSQQQLLLFGFLTENEQV